VSIVQDHRCVMFCFCVEKFQAHFHSEYFSAHSIKNKTSINYYYHSMSTAFLQHKLAIPAISSYFLLVNGATAYAFYDDKQRALANSWRIPEKSLCLLGLLGGWPAGYLAMKQFKHKTKKQSFRNMFFNSSVGNVFLLGVAGHRLKGGRMLTIQKLLKEGIPKQQQQHTFKYNPQKQNKSQNQQQHNNSD
jgi:uncharacterized membrane protein YsdA (DUF1294 family)